MPETDIGEATASDLTESMVDYSVSPQTLDSAQDQKETQWIMQDWSKNLGYYKAIPELKVAIDTKATWTVGAGYEADTETELLLDTIKGNGKDSFNSILKNMIKVKDIGGDSFAEIIREPRDGVLVNLKPLDPSKIKIVQNMQGRIIRYEQITKRKILFIFKRKNYRYKPEEIFHLSRERIGDEIHGISVIPSVQWIIDARNEAMADWKRVMHRNVEPLFIFHLDTDDTDEIEGIKTKYNNARKEGENLFVPKGAVEPEAITISTNANLNPLNWINQLNDYFFQAVNVPQIIIGNAKEFTDASGKIVYLSYEQSVKAEQLYIEEQVLGQLNLEIHLTFPASLQNEAITDQPNPAEMKAEEEPLEQANQTNDTKEELEGKK